MQDSQSERRFKRQRVERRTSTTETNGESDTALDGGDDDWRTRVVQEREQPRVSEIWLRFSAGFLFCAIGTCISALTLSQEVEMRPSELWIVTGGLLLAATLCFLAHWDVNRGRRVKEREIKEKAAS